MNVSVRRCLVVAVAALCGLFACGDGGAPVPEVGGPVSVTPPAELRAQMVADLRGRGIADEKVLRALGRVERHRFIPRAAHEAYEEKSLPIGCGQTISSPYLVAVMTELLDLDGTERVLEIGTGSGYQAAVLAEIVPKVCSMEILEELAVAARDRLRELGYENVEVMCGNGYEGWPARAPFDAIVVTAAPPEVPQALLDQLAPGGRMVVPLGEWPANQMLTRITKSADGSIQAETKNAVVWFGPMLRDD